jgi:hypothetical protein
MTYAAAFDAVKSKRSIDPNFGFEQHLRTLETEIET